MLVEEPSEIDTIAILRGLKPKYELHHGVDITDGAVIAAAKLSMRYITDRQLPDKAIDLIDEAASRIRMEMDSKPERLDRLDRKLIQLKIENEALKKGNRCRRPGSSTTVRARHRYLGARDRRFGRHLDSRKICDSGYPKHQRTDRLGSYRTGSRAAAGDLSRMSELQYGTLPDLEKQLSAAEAGEGVEMTLIRSRVGEEEVAEVVSRWTGVPVSKMLEGEREKLLRMEEELHRAVVGQAQAVQAVSDAVRRARSGLSDPNRPNGSFLFLGPTGVGKTELCKSLAKFLFDTEESMTRVDMSEFMEKHSVARLIGAPPGYVGYEEGGYLTEAVRRKPYSVLLLDEVEKAHPDVFNILLQVLEDGRLTDGQGRTVDFRNTVIVMTSNLGSELIQAATRSGAEQSYEESKAAVMNVVGSHFRPEFINRIDETVVFHALGAEHIQDIAEIQLKRLSARLVERDLSIELSDAAMDQLVVLGYDPVYGARPLKRAIQQWLENPLARKLLAGDFLPGSQIQVDVQEGDFTFN